MAEREGQAVRRGYQEHVRADIKLISPVRWAISSHCTCDNRLIQEQHKGKAPSKGMAMEDTVHSTPHLRQRMITELRQVAPGPMTANSHSFPFLFLFLSNGPAFDAQMSHGSNARPRSANQAHLLLLSSSARRCRRMHASCRSQGSHQILAQPI